MDYLNTITNWLADLVFPARCIGCNALDTYLCSTCMATMKTRSHQECIVCTRQSVDGKTCTPCQLQTAIDRLLIASPSDNPLVVGAVWSLKYRFLRAIAEPLSRWLVDSLTLQQSMRSAFYSNPLIMAVPLHHRRLRERGFNQSELLARHIAVTTAMPHIHDALIRWRHTASQVSTASRSERLDNMKEAFVCTQPEKVRGHDIILIDDVCTTGATLNACAMALKNAGAKSVTAVVLIRG